VRGATNNRLNLTYGTLCLYANWSEFGSNRLHSVDTTEEFIMANAHGDILVRFYNQNPGLIDSTNAFQTLKKRSTTALLSSLVGPLATTPPFCMA
jgi:hypothetical protein